MSIIARAKQALRSAIHACGYEVLPHPLGEWYFRQLTLGRQLMQLFDRGRINCVIDVGAHHGEYGSFLRQLGYRGRIVSFEPVRETFEHLKAQALKDPIWMIERVALGSTEGVAEIQVYHATELSSFLPPNDYCAYHMGEPNLVAGSEQVQVKTLDGVFQHCIDGIQSPRVYLKLDAQGMDLSILRSATECINKIYGLQSEISLKPIYDGMPSYLETIPAMCAMGFEVAGLFPVNHDRAMRLIEVDCVMVRSDEANRTSEPAQCCKAVPSGHVSV